MNLLDHAGDPAWLLQDSSVFFRRSQIMETGDLCNTGDFPHGPPVTWVAN